MRSSILSESQPNSPVVSIPKGSPDHLSFQGEVGANGVLDLSSKTTEELEEIRLELINNCMFAEAEAVAIEKLNKLKEEEKEKASTFVDFFDRLYSEAHKTYDEHLESIHSKYKAAELQIRKSISNRFHQYQVDHISALVEAEKEFIIRNTKKSMKPPQKAKDLIDQASKTAKTGDYLYAQQLVDYAAEVGEISRIDSKNEVFNEFSFVRNAILSHQKAELLELTRKLDIKLAMLTKQMNEEVNRLNVTYIKELGISQTTAKKNAMQKAQSKTIRDLALQLISQSYQEKTQSFSSSKSSPI